MALARRRSSTSGWSPVRSRRKYAALRKSVIQPAASGAAIVEPAMRAKTAGGEASTRPAARPPATPAANTAVFPAADMAETLPLLAAVDPGQVIGEAARHAGWRDATLDLPQRHDDQLAAGAVAAAHEDQRAVDEVAHVDGPARRARAHPARRLLGHPLGLDGAFDARDDLAARVDLAGAAADA